MGATSAFCLQAVTHSSATDTLKGE